MSIKLDDFKDVIRYCDYSNTYKMAWAKGIVELSSNYSNDKTTIIPLKDICEKMFKYYWDQTIYFNLYQSSPNQPPEILQNVKYMIDLYQKDYGYIPVVFVKVENILLDKYAVQYNKAISKIMTNAKTYVLKCFLNLNHQSYSFYKYDNDNKQLIFESSFLKQINNDQQNLFDLINYRWSMILENYNSCPRIAKKVRIMDEQDIKRKNLTCFDIYLDLENEEHVCFICGKKIDNNDLSRDHVIPWSYIYSDDLWNIVYVHKGCNSVKSNIVPSNESIIKLKDRNKRLQKYIEDKYYNKSISMNKILLDFDYAIKNNYVDKFYIGCKGC